MEKVRKNHDVGVDGRGKHKKRGTPKEKMFDVRAHIESFLVIESHYCRKSSTKNYLESSLDLQKLKMYDLYKPL